MPKKAKIRREIQSAWARLNQGYLTPDHKYPKHYREFDSSDELYLYSCSGKLKSRTVCKLNFPLGYLRRVRDYCIINPRVMATNIYILGIKPYTSWVRDEPEYKNFIEFGESDKFNTNLFNPEDDSPYPDN
jgi:hypothetical protein